MSLPFLQDYEYTHVQNMKVALISCIVEIVFIYFPLVYGPSTLTGMVKNK